MSRRGSRLLHQESGFTIVESTIALALVFAVLVGLLGSLTAGIRGVVTGRQRGAALALANEVLEQARGRGYTEVGHDLDSDPTLDDDPMLSGSPLTYSGEPLAASVVDAGAAGGSLGNPLFPFSPHRWDSTREGTTYTTAVYVTQVTPASGDSYKRVTVSVSWSPAQYATARVVTLSSFLFGVTPPPDPRLVGEAEADSGSFTVTGFLSGIGLSEARLTLPYASGTIDSGFIRTARGFATTARSEISLTSGTLSGCSVSGGGLQATCPGSKAEAGADNDSGTAPPDSEQIGPVTDPGGTLVAGTPLPATVLGGGAADALATARCSNCSASGIGDDDLLPYQWARSSGPAGMSVELKTGSASGFLLSSPTGCATDCARVEVDRDADVTGTAQRVRSTASVTYPAIDLVTFPGLPTMVKVGAASVSASAESGPLALAPSTTGGAVTVQMYDNTLVPGYTTLTVVPGSPSPPVDPTSHAEFSVGGASVTMDARVHWGPATTEPVLPGSEITEARASLTNWLWVEVRLRVIQNANKEADLVLHLDYGRISARATYEAVV